ncbi:hypothetical protein [Desulfosarcina variabilis]|uniref:hypothetical protein n=1 Tax=Desulfosarcina variabilis TaxID=2300 RepID=UPI003AFA1AEB
MSMAIAIAVLWTTGVAAESDATLSFPPNVNTALHTLLDLVGQDGDPALDNRQLECIVDFLSADKSDKGIYSADSSFGVPSAFHQFPVKSDLQEIIDYTLDANIPSFFFWPTSLRLTQWTRVDGGDKQFDRLQAASRQLDEPFIFKGAERVTITPDQHTGAYYTYDVNKLIILSPCRQGQVMISIYRQQAPSAVGRRGWVLGQDDEWSYLYTQEKGLNLKGLGWADTYMYDSFGITVYYQPSIEAPLVTAGVFSWVKAGWARINMVQPKHIHNGLVRVALAFTEVLEDPKLPEPKILAETFSKSKDLPTPVLRKYASNYLSGLKERISSSCSDVWKKVADDFDSRELLDQMSRDELYAVVALDYLKKILGRNPVMDSHPF